MAWMEALMRSVVRQNRRVESGFSLSFQLKASTLWQLDPTHVIYDLEVKTYNDLILRRSIKTATPCILILLAFALQIQPIGSSVTNQNCDCKELVIGNIRVEIRAIIVLL